MNWIEYHKLSITGILLGACCPGLSDIPIYDDGNRRSYTVIDETTIFIESYLLSATSVVGRYHFTLAHEISHKLFWLFYPESIGDGLAARRIRYCKAPNHNACPEEKDMDALAAAILMPPLLIRRKMEEVGLNGKIPLLNSVYAKDDYGKFCAIAEALRVSKKALCIRMQQFGLIEKEYLYNPYDLINVYMTNDFDDITTEEMVGCREQSSDAGTRHTAIK